MENNRNTVKLAPDAALGEARRIQPVPSHDSRHRRESLIEAAMEAALRDVSRFEKAELFRAEQPLVEQPIERKPDIWPENKSGIGVDNKPDKDIGARFPNRDSKKNGVLIEPEQSISISDATNQCERLKAHICTHYVGETMKSVLFVGITSGSGVSTAAANFAGSLAYDGESKVLLMDANYRSKARRYHDAGKEEGDNVINLAKLLADPSPVCPAPGPSNLYVLPRGTPAAPPLSLFQSNGFDELLYRVQQNFGYVVIDGPALLDCPESLVLSRKVDGVILVVESEKTRKRTAVWAKEQIEDAGGKLLGVVLNKRKYYIPDWLYRHI